MPAQKPIRGWRIWAILLVFTLSGGYITCNLFKVQIL